MTKTINKKGATTFFSPVFEQKETVSPEANIKAMELDGVLQEYLNSYFAMRGAEEAEKPPISGNEYIEERNRELEQGEDFTPFENSAPVVGDEDIPF